MFHWINESIRWMDFITSVFHCIFAPWMNYSNEQHNNGISFFIHKLMYGKTIFFLYGERIPCMPAAMLLMIHRWAYFCISLFRLSAPALSSGPDDIYIHYLLWLPVPAVFQSRASRSVAYIALRRSWEIIIFCSAIY